MDTGLIKEISERIGSSKKYRSVYPVTIKRVVGECLQRFGAKRAEGEARKMLHQIWGAYWSGRPNFAKLLSSVSQPTSEAAMKEEALRLMALQSSTRERISLLNEFYQRIFAVTGSPASVLDQACGLNPLSYPWMGLADGSSYRAHDIDREEVEFLQAMAERWGWPGMQVSLGDVLVDQFESAEVALMLKLLPCLEQQQNGSGLAAMKAQPVRFVVASYPVRSLGGSEKGMVEFYSRQFAEMMEKAGWRFEKLLFETELVFVVEKAS